MAGRQRRRGGRNSGGPRYPRSARVGETLREIIAEELVRIDDEDLSFVSVTSIDVDPELNRATVYFDSLDGEDGDERIVEALSGHRVRLQASIASQAAPPAHAQMRWGGVGGGGCRGGAGVWWGGRGGWGGGGMECSGGVG